MDHFMNINIYSADVIKRPSATCKTPYVADICIDNDFSLAHAPALGCCGLSDKNSKVMVSKNDNKKNKCQYRIELAIIYEREQKIVIGINPKLAEDIVNNLLLQNKISFLQNNKLVKREQKILQSRYDFYGIDKNDKEFFMEIKNVPLADYVDVPKKERKNYNGIEIGKDINDKIAYFPDGYRKSNTDVVSPRALKHIQELEIISKTTQYRTILCFVVQREDVMQFQPSNIDPTYKHAVRNAWLNGVEIRAIQVVWNDCGECVLKNNKLPVVLFDTYGPFYSVTE
jgi:DNA-binding sugar fermentation-stimulating protein